MHLHCIARQYDCRLHIGDLKQQVVTLYHPLVSNQYRAIIRRADVKYFGLTFDITKFAEAFAVKDAPLLSPTMFKAQPIMSSEDLGQRLNRTGFYPLYAVFHLDAAANVNHLQSCVIDVGYKLFSSGRSPIQFVLLHPGKENHFPEHAASFLSDLWAMCTQQLILHDDLPPVRLIPYAWLGDNGQLATIMRVSMGTSKQRDPIWQNRSSFFALCVGSRGAP